jgi:uncharacterized membrane protein YagU involved in acid resistance
MMFTLQAILWGGLLCGVLDAAAAMVQFGLQDIPPVRVWQRVASGLIGEQAFHRGWITAALGLLLHFFIAFSAATVFCVAASHIPLLLESPLVAGALYGICVFLVMNLIVIPLSAGPKRKARASTVAVQVVIHILFVGLPISLSASHFLSQTG